MLEYLQKKIQFTPVPQNEDCESLMNTTDKYVEFRNKKPERSQILSSLLFLVALLASGFLGAVFGSKFFMSEDRLCTKHITQYCKEGLVSAEGNRRSTVRFNGTLMDENIYRQNGSPEVDAAWQALGVDYRPALVPSRLGPAAGLLPSHVQVKEKYGGGYPANVEGLHHLHCLNLLRQTLWFNYDYYHTLGQGAFLNDDAIVRVHVTHCLDILRQQLMCTTDIGVLGQVWWDKKAPAAFTDFNTEHKCKNFDAVRQWAFEHQAPKDVPDDYLEMPRMEDVLDTMP